MLVYLMFLVVGIGIGRLAPPVSKAVAWSLLVLLAVLSVGVYNHWFFVPEPALGIHPNLALGQLVGELAILFVVGIMAMITFQAMFRRVQE